MKKSIIVVLALVSALMVVCAACGSGSDTAEVSATVSPEEETVTVTPPPAEESEAPMVTAEPTEQSETTDEQDTAEDEDVPEDMVTAQGMIGQNVSELYAAIGEPESSEYTESCLVEDGNDGLLYYDGFTVSTTRYADGTEVVMGAY